MSCNQKNDQVNDHSQLGNDFQDKEVSDKE